jgi:hypothetical protein
MKKSLILLAINGLLSLLVLIPNLVRAQQHEMPPPTPSLYDWVPDCSHEGAPLPSGKINLHRYSPDNTGTPRMDIPNPLDGTHNGLYIGRDIAIDAASDGDDMMTVSESAPGEVWQDNAGLGTTGDGNAHSVTNYGSITLRRINSVTNTVIWERKVDDGLASASLPHIVQSSTPGTYFVTYRTHSASGDQVFGTVWQDNGTLVGRTSLLGTTHLYRIQEYALAADDAGNAAVAIICDVNSTDHFETMYAKMVDLTLTTHWGAGVNYPLEISGATTMTPSTKSWPVINYNTIRSQYEILWGDLKRFGGQPDEDIFAQTVTIAGATYYPAGGMWDTYAQAQKFSVFMAKTCPGLFDLSGHDMGETVILYQDGSGDCYLHGVVLGLGWPIPAVYMGVFIAPGEPSSLVIYPITSSISSPVGLVADRYSGTLYANAGDVWTGSTLWNCAAATPASMIDVCPGYSEWNANGIFTLLPGAGTEILYRLDPSIPAFSGATTIDLRENLPGAWIPNAISFAACLGPSKFNVLNFESGPFNSTDIVAYLSTPNPETDENQREKWANFSNYTQYSNTTNASNTTPFTAALTLPVQCPVMDHAPSTSVWQSVRGTAFERFHPDGTNDLLLGYRNTVAGPDPPPIVVESATPNVMFVRPKCAVINNGAQNIAIVTYERNDILSSISTYQYKVIGLTSLSTLASGVLAFSSHSDDYRNWDPVFDPINLDYLFFYGSGYALSLPNLSTAGFSWAGAPLGWGTSLLRPASFGVGIEDVRTCFNPDPANPGAYAVWREGSGAAPWICLDAVRTLTGANWVPGTIAHAAFGFTTYRSQPVVSAGTDWCLLAWEDWQAGTGVPQIYGCGYDNFGVRPGFWNPNGSLLSVASGVNFEARQPDVAAIPGSPIAVIAYEQDNDPSQVIFPANARSISYVTVPVLSGPLPISSRSLQIGAPSPLAGTYLTDALYSMTGFEQRRPKLTPVNPSVNVGTYLPGPPYMLCTFESEAYPIWSGSSPYLDIRNEEIAKFAGGIGEPQYQQGNIAAVLFLPFGPPSPIARYSIGRATNAQNLVRVDWSDDQQFVATYVDYTGSDNHAGIAKTVDINFDVREFSTFASYGLSWDRMNLVRAMHLYNNSLYELLLDASPSCVNCMPAPPNTWTTTDPVTIGAFSSNTLTVTYSPPALPSHGVNDLTVHLFPNIVAGALQPMIPDIRVTGAAGTGTYKNSFSVPAVDEKFSLSLSANPALGSTTLTAKGFAGTEVGITMCDLLGREILKSHIVLSLYGTASIPLSLTNLPAGSYVIRAQSAGMETSTMLSVNH